MQISDRILRMGARRGLKSPRAIAIAAELIPSTVYPKFKTNKGWTIDEMVAFGKALKCDPLWLAYGTPWTEQDREALRGALLNVFSLLIESDYTFSPELLPLVVDVALDLAADAREGTDVSSETVKRRWDLAVRLNRGKK